MFRKIFTTILIVAALLTGPAIVPGFGGNIAVASDSPDGHSPYHEHHVRVRVHRVYYRTCPDSPWGFYGSYQEQHRAWEAVSYLQTNGYDAFSR